MKRGATSPSSGAEGRRGLPAWKRALFGLTATLLFFTLLEGLLALAGVRPVFYEEDPYVGFASNVPLFVESRGAGGEVEMVTAPNKLAWFNEQRFPREKPSGTYRIFTLGGSTTYGRPYDDAVSFTGWLRELLSSMDAGRDWEVINAGGISYASYRVAVVMEELVRYDPDLFIVYTGHNEFLEARTYQGIIAAPRMVTDVGAVLSRTRIYAAARTMARGGPRQAETGTKTVLQGEVDPLLEHSVGPSEYTRDDVQRARTIGHFRFNLHRMIDIARSAGAALVLVTPASNWKDFSPFKSEHRRDLGAGERRRFQELLERAAEERGRGRLEDALGTLDEALVVDDRYAQLHYERGRLLYELGRFELAGDAFRRALDEDICPLRAPSAIEDAIRDVAAERDVPLADFASGIREVSENGITGSDSFQDHVHPTIEGYRRVALDLVETLEGMGVVEPSEAWNEGALRAVVERVESRVDRRAHGVAQRNLAKVLAWAGKLDEAERAAAQAAEILGDDAEAVYTLGLGAAERGQLDEAVKQYRRALELDPGLAKARNSLGVALVARGELADAIEQFREAIDRRPGFAEAHYNLANALESEGKLEAAVEHFRRALEARPDFADAGNNLGVALLSIGRTDEGMASLRRVLELRPDFAEAELNLGIALSTQGRLDEAMGRFRRVLELEPDSPEAHYYLGMSLGAKRRFRDAAAHFRKAVARRPDYPEARYNLGNALTLAGRVGDGIHHLEEAVRLKPDWPAPRVRLAWLLATSPEASAQDARRAVGLAERAADLTRHEDPSALDTLAAAYAAVGRFDRAVETAERAVRLATNARDDAFAGRMRERLALYREGKPFRDPSSAATKE